MDDNNFHGLLEEIDSLRISGGVDMNELLNISDTLRELLVWMLRRNGFAVEELSAYLSCEPAVAQQLIEVMSSKLLVEEVLETQTFRLHMASSRAARKYRVSDDVWRALD